MSPLQGYIPLADRDSYNCVSRTLTRPGSKANPYWVQSALQLCFLQTCHPYRVWFRWPIMVSTTVSPARPRCLSGRPGSKANPYRVTFRRPPRNTEPAPRTLLIPATRTFAPRTLLFPAGHPAPSQHAPSYPASSALINKKRPNPSP